jgi:DNA-binding CsgD family transcriptional regulator
MVVAECVAGELGRALERAEEAYELALEASQLASAGEILATRGFVEAHLGDEQAVRRDVQEALRLGAPGGARLAERMAGWALGLLELSLGNPAEAHRHLAPVVAVRRAAGVGEPGDLRFVPDDIEALLGFGQLEDAEAMLEWYEGLAQTSGRLHALAAAGRCRGLLHAARGETDRAVAELEGALSRYRTIDDPFGTARTLLALGMAERRRLHKSAARTTLEMAVAAFEALGARIWAQAATAELGRVGGRAASPDALTPSERSVASLVAEGKTNREVAAVLYLTERTVEGHLSRIYAKLGIRSRSELAHHFALEPPPT